MFFDFRTPQIKKLSIVQCTKFWKEFKFDHLVATFEYGNMLRDKFRAVLAENLKNRLKRPDIILPVVADYLAVLNACVSEIDGEKEIINNKAKTMSKIEWESVFDKKSKRYCLSANFWHEQAQTYQFWALQYYENAQRNFGELDLSDGVQEEHNGTLIEIMKDLRLAAGIFDYAAKNLYPFYITKKTVDQCSDIYRGMAKVCVGLAQEILIMVAVSKKKSPVLLAKLAQGVSETYGEIFPLWQKNLGPAFNELDQSLILYIKQRRDLLRAMAFHFLGKDAYTNDKWGEAICYYNYSISMIQACMKDMKRSQYKVIAKHPSCVQLWKCLQITLETVEADSKVANNENDMIYHALVPEDIELLPQPEAKMMTKATEVSHPEVPKDMPKSTVTKEWAQYVGKWTDADGNIISVTRSGGFFYEGKDSFRQGSINPENKDEINVSYGEKTFTGVMVHGNVIEWSNDRQWKRVSG